MNDIQVIKTKKDYYKTIFNGVDLFGELERSEYRHFMEVLDNKTQH